MRTSYVVDAESNTKTYSYSPWGELYKAVDPLGNTFQTDVDLIARKRTTYFMANGTSNKQNVVEEYYNQWGKVQEKKAYPSWPSTSVVLSEKYTYDYDGNVTAHTNPNGDTTNFVYDKLNRLYQVKDPLNQTTEYGYSVLGDLSTIKQADGTQSWVTSKEYNELGNLTKKTSPSGEAEIFVPNALSLTDQQTDLNKHTFNYSYDSHQRETILDGGTASFKFTYYHPFGASWIEQFNNGQLVGMQGLGYNPLGQVDYANLYIESFQHKTYYSYDKMGKLTQIQDPFSFYTKYGYNKNRLTNVQTDGSSTSNGGDEANARYEFNANGSIKSITYPKLKDGSYLKAAYEYDDLNRMTKVTNTKGSQVLSQYSYTYDKNGNIISVADGQSTTSYIYDKLNRLIEVHRPDGTITKFSYDARGNRKTITNDTWAMNLEATDYTFNIWNQLTEVKTGTQDAVFQYGPNGLRTKKITPSEMTRYHYNNNGKVIAESDASNNVIAHYVWGSDRILDKKDATGNDYYYLYNGHGDVVQIVDSNGAVVNDYHYDEWGNVLSQTEKIKNSFKYAGEAYDSETGLYYLRARYYDPSLGRFINKDTYEGDITNPLSLNIYTYTANNPLKYIDPSGHDYLYSQNQYDYLMALADDGNEWAAKQLDEGRYYVDEDVPGVAVNSDEALVLSSGVKHDELSQLIIDSALTGGVAALEEKATQKSAGELLSRVSNLFTRESAQQISFATGRAGEQYLAEMVGATAQNIGRNYFATSMGARYVDVKKDGVAYESKVGYASLTSFVRKQVLKDSELMQTGSVNSVEWHFFRSSISDSIGPSQPLSDLLTEHGIKVIIH